MSPAGPEMVSGPSLDRPANGGRRRGVGHAHLRRCRQSPWLRHASILRLASARTQPRSFTHPHSPVGLTSFLSLCRFAPPFGFERALGTLGRVGRMVAVWAGPPSYCWYTCPDTASGNLALPHSRDDVWGLAVHDGGGVSSRPGGTFPATRPRRAPPNSEGTAWLPDPIATRSSLAAFRARSRTSILKRPRNGDRKSVV